MSIIMTNVSGSILSIDDLGVELPIGADIDLEDNFTDEDLIASTGLQAPMDNNDVTVEVNSASMNYTQLIAYLKKLSEYQHETLDTLTHGLSEVAYFETAKDVDGRTQYITYYTDSNKTTKVREEEITRDVDGKAASVITRQYNSNGDLVKTMTETLNRDVDGKVENVGYTVT